MIELRHEIKALLCENQYNEVFKTLASNGWIESKPQARVGSIYLDTDFHDCFHRNLNFRLRFRYYLWAGRVGTFFEMKSKEFGLSSKRSIMVPQINPFNLSRTDIRNIIYCYPSFNLGRLNLDFDNVLQITYTRSYFTKFASDDRITVDSRLEYRTKNNDEICIKPEFIIIEKKINRNLNSDDPIFFNLAYEQKFSKFKFGMEKIYCE